VTNIVLLNSESHRKLRIHAQPALEFGDNQRFVQVVISEFPSLALHYPILFSKDAETGQFYCGAMLGFDVGENLFFDAHREQALYRPLNLRRTPFYTAGDNLAIDLDNPRVNAAGDQALFNEAGEPSAYLQSVMGMMQELKPGIEQTKTFAAALMDLKLIEGVTIKTQFDDGTQREVTGLYTVNPEKLMRLDDTSALDLFRRGYLQLIYLQRASLEHLSTLMRMKNRKFLPQQPPEHGPDAA
jgi:SapC